MSLRGFRSIKNSRFGNGREEMGNNQSSLNVHTVHNQGAVHMTILHI